MQQVAVIGLGDMGSGLAKNLLQAGFTVKGHDIDPQRMKAFAQMGGTLANNAADAGDGSDAVFIMVMNGRELFDVVSGKDGLLTSMNAGSSIILTATVHAREARELGELLSGTGIDLIDSPVSGGFPGAQGGTLTLMLSAPRELLERCRPALEAISGTIHHVGIEAGAGQTVKACLQSIIGPIFSAVYEASVLAAKNGVDAAAFQKVVANSSAGCIATSGSLENIIDQKFKGTGSHIRTMHKDLTISMDLARESGVPLFTTSMAMQLFQAGITKHPDGDNQIVTQVMEDIVGASLIK